MLLLSSDSLCSVAASIYSLVSIVMLVHFLEDHFVHSFFSCMHLLFGCFFISLLLLLLIWCYKNWNCLIIACQTLELPPLCPHNFVMCNETLYIFAILWDFSGLAPAYLKLKFLANHILKISVCTGLLHVVQSLKITCTPPETCCVMPNQQIIGTLKIK